MAAIIGKFGERVIDWKQRLSDAESPPLILDGAMGSALEAAGLPCQVPLWSAEALLDAPEQVSALHRAYRSAGADVLTANTFRTQARTLAKGGQPGRSRELTHLAVALALEASDGALVAGSMAPLEDCYEPARAPANARLEHEHREHAAHLAEAGCHLLLVETQNNQREAAVATRAAAQTGLPVLASVVCDPLARLLSGEVLDDTLEALAQNGAAVVGVNCVSLDTAARCLPSLQRCSLPFLVSPNLAFATPTPDAPFRASAAEHAAGPAAYAAEAATWVRAGARIVGGCCGTTPDHIAALRRLVV